MKRYACTALCLLVLATANFADAPAIVRANGNLIYRFGKAVDDGRMMAHGAFAAFFRDERGIPGDSIGRQLPALFTLAEFRRDGSNNVICVHVFRSVVKITDFRSPDLSAFDNTS